MGMYVATIHSQLLLAKYKYLMDVYTYIYYNFATYKVYVLGHQVHTQQ